PGLLIRLEFLAVLDTDRLHLEPFDRREDFRWLFVDELRERFVEREAVRVDGVHFLPRAVDELHRRRGVLLRQRIDLELLHQGDGFIRLPILLESAQSEEHAVSGRLDDEVSGRRLAGVSRRYQEILSARALVWTRWANVGEVALQSVRTSAEHLG